MLWEHTVPVPLTGRSRELDGKLEGGASVTFIVSRRSSGARSQGLAVGACPGVAGTTTGDEDENVRAALGWAAESDACARRRLFAATRDLLLHARAGRRPTGGAAPQLVLERCLARDRCRVEVLITAGILAMATPTHARQRPITARRGG